MSVSRRGSSPDDLQIRTVTARAETGDVTSDGDTAVLVKLAETAPNPGQEWELHGFHWQGMNKLTDGFTNIASRSEETAAYVGFSSDPPVEPFDTINDTGSPDKDGDGSYTASEQVAEEMDTLLAGSEGSIRPQMSGGDGALPEVPFTWERVVNLPTPITISDLEDLHMLAVFHLGETGNYEDGICNGVSAQSLSLMYLPK